MPIKNLKTIRILKMHTDQVMQILYTIKNTGLEIIVVADAVVLGKLLVEL